MSVLFPKVNKPRQWDFRPRYYDAEKERQQKWREEYEHRRKANIEKEQSTNADGSSADSNNSGNSQPPQYSHTLHRGSFREAREMSEYVKAKSQRRSKMLFWLIALMLVIVVFLLLK